MRRRKKDILKEAAVKKRLAGASTNAGYECPQQAGKPGSDRNTNISSWDKAFKVAIKKYE